MPRVDRQPNRGEAALAPYLKTDEVHITNTKIGIYRRETYAAPGMGVFGADVPTVSEDVRMYERKGYYDIRVLDVAFAQDGTRLSTYAAIVGKVRNITGE